MTRALAMLAATTLTAPQPALANDARGIPHAGGFTIRYNALASNALPADATAGPGLAHSAQQGIVNVVVHQGRG